MIPSIYFKSNWKAFAILIVGISLTILVAFYTKTNNDLRLNQEFKLVCNDIKSKITARLYTHAQLLRSGASFIEAADTVTRKKWNSFIESSKLSKNLPGIQGVGFSVVIKKAQLDAHIHRIRMEGFPDYHIFPAGDREKYTSILFLEPFSDRNLRAFGYDMYAEPIRKKAMDQACDYDLATLSGKVVLMQETGEELQPGTLMYVPVYQKDKPTNTIEQRRAAILGWVYSPYRMFDLLNGILGRWDLDETYKIRLQVYDNDQISQNSLLFDSQRPNSMALQGSSEPATTIPIEFNGKRWTLKFMHLNSQISFHQGITFTILFSGLIISFLLFSLYLSLYNTNFRASQVADKLASKLNESENRFSLFMDHLPAIVFLKDNEGRALFVNAFMDNALGASKWLGKNMFEIFPNEFGAKFLEGDLNVIRKGYEKLDEHILLLDGTLHYFETQKFIIPRPGQEPYLGGISLDITERRQTELSLQEKNDELIRLNATKDKFFSIVAHDLRGPLGSILGLTQLMTDDLSDMTLAEIQRMIGIMNESLINLNLLLGNLLEWSRMNSGLSIFKPEIFLLAPKIEEVNVLLAQAAIRKEISIVSEIPEELHVCADANMLASILRNLVTNAVKFTAKGGSIKISAKFTDQNFALIAVQDTGIGIQKEMIEDLFRLDSKSRRAGTEGEPSTGLGLLICKEFVEKHNGKLWVDSDQGVGTTFYFSLPLYS